MTDNVSGKYWTVYESGDTLVSWAEEDGISIGNLVLSSISANKLIFELDDRRLKVVGNARDTTTRGLYVIGDVAPDWALKLGSGTDANVIRITNASSIASGAVVAIDTVMPDRVSIIRAAGNSSASNGEPLTLYGAYDNVLETQSLKVNYV